YVRGFLGVAAALLFALLGWYFWPKPMSLDWVKIVDEANRPPRSGEEVLASFKQKGLRAQLPVQNLNYHCLTYCARGYFEGRQVPVLEFQNEKGLLRVYILDGQLFDLNPLGGTYSGRVTMVPRVHPDGRYGYIFSIIGDRASLEDFLTRVPAT